VAAEKKVRGNGDEVLLRIERETLRGVEIGILKSQRREFGGQRQQEDGERE